MTTEMKKNSRGFSLIELIIVVAIVGIIAGIGYPSYANYLSRAARGEASAMLLDVMEKQEQYYRRKLTYTTDLTDLRIPGLTTDGSLVTDSERHEISVDKCPNVSSIRRCVLLTAKAQNGQSGEPDMSLDSRGTKIGWSGSH